MNHCRRWQAQGMQVRKGEHGIHIQTYAPVTRTEVDPATGQETTIEAGKRPTLAFVFCRHQVDAKA
ncbi:MAG: ArdC-like ssDNA-binding domain-containing protein [Chloroflexi bacterium]|nr:ArdC-like ssDNA-binding domain-containing protein [Chloroflexota bacterium]